MKKSLCIAFVLACFPGVAYTEAPVVGIPEAYGILGRQQQRTILSKTDLAVAPGMEAIVLTVEGAPGLVGKRHYHPGDEFIYVEAGSLTLHVDGKRPVTLTRGETLHIPARVVHQAVNPSQGNPFKAVTFGIFEKGQADTTVVGE